MTWRAALALALVLAWAPAQATTYYLDSTSGSDSNAGTSRPTAWKNWGKFVDAINKATIQPGDTVLFRPGRYYASQGAARWLMNGPGGTAGSPITVSVDTNYAGSVEIDGSIQPGLTGASAWQQAWICVGGTADQVPCDNAAPDCPSGGVCTQKANVYYTNITNTNDSTGNVGGTAFQPGTNPGDPPKLFEVLFSPPSTPIKMPTFTSGHDQVWAYSEKATVCRAANSPWQCCTGTGVGATCLKSQRIYVQTSASIRPDLVAPPVEVPYGTILDVNGGPVSYLTFTNSNNGRMFYFWWSQKLWWILRNAVHWTVEDFDFAYSSGIVPACDKAPCGASGARGAWIDSGSGWPRNNGGSFYGIQSVGASTNNEHHNTFRRGTFEKTAGDEIIHLNHFETTTGACATAPTCSGSPGVCSNNASTSCNVATQLADCLAADCTATSNGGAGSICSAGTCVYSRNGADLFDTVTFTDAAWAVANGATPNGVSVAQSWPPVGYRNADGLVSGWDTIYSFWSPLGGGGQSGNCGIAQSAFNRITNFTMSNCTGWSWENLSATNADGYNYGNVIEKGTYDAAQLQYRADATTSLFPANPVGTCDGGPSGPFCKGFSGGNVGIIWEDSFGVTGAPGNVLRNVLIKNGYGFPLYPGFKNAMHTPPTLSPNEVVNVTVELKGNSLHTTSSPAQVGFDFGYGSSTLHGIIKNLIVVAPSGTAPAHFYISAGLLGLIDIDYDDWGPGIIWKAGGTTTSTFATWQSLVSGDSHGQQADPLLDSLYHIPSNSPAKDAGTDLSALGFTTDGLGTTRPQGAAWDEGWFELTSNATTTTVSTTSTSVSTSTSVTTTTSSTSTTSTAPGFGGSRGMFVRGGRF